MKTLKYLSIIFVLSFFFTACEDNNPDIETFPSEKVAFTYAVEGDYALDYLVGSTIKFENISSENGTLKWDFGDGTTSTEENPVHIYNTAGKYKITLTINGTDYNTKDILISDIFPTVTLAPIEGGFAEIKTTPVSLSVFIPNPQNLPIIYEWIFPEGTLDANKNPISSSSAENPGQLYFNNVGSQRVVLKTTLGGRALEESVTNIPVGYNQPAKTLYFAVKGGNIMALKIVPNKPADVKILPFDLGVKAGQHPLNILFNESLLYVLDAGKQFTYINDVDGVLGDGRIFVVSKDGAKVEVVSTNSGGPAFNDPFYGYIDAASSTLYFSDRNTGITKINLDARNEVISRTYWVQNTSLGYYNNGYQYGAMNANFTKVGDTWWWAKTYNGVGVFRFKDSDIGNATSAPASGIGGENVYIKSFVVDNTRGMVYFSVKSDKSGFYGATIAQFSAIKSLNDVGPYLIQQMASDEEGASGEYIDICQMALDNEDGSVYFGYRKDANSTVPSGLKRYNPATKKIESVIDNVSIYGVAINNSKAKLF